MLALHSKSCHNSLRSIVQVGVSVMVDWRLNVFDKPGRKLVLTKPSEFIVRIPWPFFLLFPSSCEFLPKLNWPTLNQTRIDSLYFKWLYRGSVTPMLPLHILVWLPFFELNSPYVVISGGSLRRSLCCYVLWAISATLGDESDWYLHGQFGFEDAGVIFNVCDLPLVYEHRITVT